METQYFFHKLWDRIRWMGKSRSVEKTRLDRISDKKEWEKSHRKIS